MRRDAATGRIIRDAATGKFACGCCTEPGPCCSVLPIAPPTGSTDEITVRLKAKGQAIMTGLANPGGSFDIDIIRTVPAIDPCLWTGEDLISAEEIWIDIGGRTLRVSWRVLAGNNAATLNYPNTYWPVQTVIGTSGGSHTGPLFGVAFRFTYFNAFTAMGAHEWGGTTEHAGGHSALASGGEDYGLSAATSIPVGGHPTKIAIDGFLERDNMSGAVERFEFDELSVELLGWNACPGGGDALGFGELA